MDRLTRLLFCSFTIVSIMVCGIASANDKKRLRHPGNVVDMQTGQYPLIDIKGWPKSIQTGKEGDCPLYGETALDSTTSDIRNKGSFVLNIDANKPTYTTTYCATEYYPRADRDLRNLYNYSPVVPTPVEVIKRKTEKSTYAGLIKKKTIGLLSDLSYLRSFSPEMYSEVMMTLVKDFDKVSPRRAKLLYNFQYFVQEWNQ